MANGQMPLGEPAPSPRRLSDRVRARLRRQRSDFAGLLARGVKGRPRQLELDHTQIGPVYDVGDLEVRKLMLDGGIDAEYDLAYEHFDVTHFLLQAPQFLTLARDPLANFLDNGATAKASPEINFDMGLYLQRHPERESGPECSPYVAWLQHGKAAGELADPAPGLEKVADVLGLSAAEAVEELAAMRLDLQHRLRYGRLGELLNRAAEVEPLIGAAWGATPRPLIPPFYSERTSSQVHAIYRAQEQAGFERARVLLIVSDPRWGGGRRAEGHISHALSEQMDPSDIVVIYTDKPGRTPEGRFPAGVREVDLASYVDGLTPDVAGRALTELIRSFHAETVVNINSQLLYQAMQWHGAALAATERIYLLMFCNEQAANGTWVGLPMRYFYRCFDHVAGVIADSHYLADWLTERHQLPEHERQRIHVFSAPVDPTFPFVERTPRAEGARPQVYWAGRFDRQKRLDVAHEVAARMPDVDFHMWGERVLVTPGVGPAPANVQVHPRYRHISELDLGAADAWLYTSGWDGVPSLLLEVAMSGVPIVGSLVGGTGEVLLDGSWPIADFEDPDAYVAALREVLADPDAARNRARGLRERLVEERTAAAYTEQVRRVLLGADAPAAAEATR